MNSITFSPLLSPAIHRWACEHFGSVAWPQHTVLIPLVAMTADKGATVTDSASGEVSDTFAFTIWLHREAVIRDPSAEQDQCDYANALTQQQREVRLSDIGRDRVRAEREEAALVWHAQAQGDAIEHRSDKLHAGVEHVAVITKGTGVRRQAQRHRKAVQRAGGQPAPAHRRLRPSQGRGAKAVSNRTKQNEESPLTMGTSSIASRTKHSWRVASLKINDLDARKNR